MERFDKERRRVVNRTRLYTVTLLADENPSEVFNYGVNCHQIQLRLNSALIFTVSATSEGLFALLEGCLCRLGVIIIALHSFFAQYFEPSISISSPSRWKSPFDRAKCIAKRSMTYSLSYAISSVCFFKHLALVAVLDGCTVGAAREQLSLVRGARGLTSESGMRCESNTHCPKLLSPRVPNLVLRLLIHEVLDGCARWLLGHFVFINQQKEGYESNCRNWSIYIPSSCLHLHSVFFQYETHCQHPELSRHHMTYAKQRLSFRNTADTLHNCVRSLWASFCYVQLYHNANASDVDWFSTSRDGSKGQLQRK